MTGVFEAVLLGILGLFATPVIVWSVGLSLIITGKFNSAIGLSSFETLVPVGERIVNGVFPVFSRLYGGVWRWFMERVQDIRNRSPRSDSHKGWG